MPSKKIVIRKNPKLDWAIALWGGDPVPTKQDKFKPLIGYQGIVNEDGVETILEELYVRNPDKKSIQDFETKLRDYIKENMTSAHPYKMPTEVEVILSFTITKKRFFEVDVDNLSKNVLDVMKGLIFDDDSQVVNLLASKHIHPYNTNGIAIAVNEITDKSKSWFDGIKLFYIEESKGEEGNEKSE